MVVAAGLVLLIAALGTALTLWVDVPLRLEERIPLGVVVGLVAVAAGSLVGFQAFGMGWAALAVGLGPAGAAGVLAVLMRGEVLLDEVASAGRRLQLPCRAGASLRPLVLLTVACTAVTTRILSLAYQHDADGGIAAGNLAVWGDWAAHLAYAGSFAHGDNRGWNLPLADGEPLKYHVLADFASSLFTVTGLDLTRSLVLGSWLLAVAIPPLLFGAVRRLCGSRLTAGLSVVLFLLTGGVGAWYFVADDVAEGGWRMLWHLPETYARMPERHLWVDNTISASLYAQRSTQLGIAIGLGALLLLLASRPRWSRSGFLLAGLLVGASGLAHAHLLVTALALGALAFVIDRRATWWWFLGPAALVGLPLLVAIRPPSNQMRWLVGWMAVQSDQSWPWFWFRNVGLLLPLFLAVSLLGLGSARLRRLAAPLWLWFLVPNLVAFHPGEWNNTKFFLFWQLAGCIVVADLLARPWRRWGARAAGEHASGRARATGAGLRVASVVAVVLLTVTRARATLRAMQRDTAIPWVDGGDVEAAEWLRAAARPGDVLVYGASNTSAVAASSGVPAVLAYPGWVDDLGIEDWRIRLADTRTVLSGAPGALDVAARRSVDWVVIGPRERWEYEASDDFWAQHGALAFSSGEYRVYAVGPR
ncbi:MAG TPA: hypothetical protein PKE56_15245 [Acidimicrobiales bacterium]|nr:hypothetical protein [Acidimicrobiales bacterium]